MVLQLLADAPGLHLKTPVQSTDVLATALRREELDFFIGDVRVPPQDRDLIAEPLLPCGAVGMPVRVRCRQLCRSVEFAFAKLKAIA